MQVCIFWVPKKQTDPFFNFSMLKNTSEHAINAGGKCKEVVIYGLPELRMPIRLV